MRITITALLLSTSCFAFGQKLADIGINVRINESDHTTVADIKPVNGHINIEPTATYYWYGSNTIHHTQGGYSGRLLNGIYNEYYLNKNLKLQGVYNKGLNDGVWKYWNENGLLKSLTTYRKGVKSGDFIVYDDMGKPLQSGTYRDGMINGKAIFYYQDSTVSVSYKNGRPLPKKAKKKFWDKWNIFRKHHPDPKTTPVKATRK